MGETMDYGLRFCDDDYPRTSSCCVWMTCRFGRLRQTCRTYAGECVKHPNIVMDITLPFTSVAGMMRWFFNLIDQPIWALAMTLINVTLVLGGLLLVEPATWLTVRRGEGAWKILPWLRRLHGVRELANRLQSIIFRSDKSRTMSRILRLALTPITLPIMLGLALLDVPVLRSMVVLTLLPFVVLTGITWVLKKLRVIPTLDASVAQQNGGSRWAGALDLKTLAVTIGAPGTTWCLTALVLLCLFLLDPIRRTYLRWLVGDAPLGIYLIVLAVILVFGSMTATLSRGALAADPSATGASLVDMQRDLTGGALAAAVAGMWIIRIMNPRLFAYRRCVGDA